MRATWWPTPRSPGTAISRPATSATSRTSEISPLRSRLPAASASELSLPARDIDHLRLAGKHLARGRLRESASDTLTLRDWRRDPHHLDLARVRGVIAP